MSEEVLIVGKFSPPIVDKLGERYTLHQVGGPGEFDSMSNDVLSRVSGFASHGWAPAEIIDKMPNLKMISSFGVGYDGVAAEHAASKGIMVGHTPDVLNDEVANTALALILATDRRIVAYDKYVREGRWEKEGNAPLTRGLANKKVGQVEGSKFVIGDFGKSVVALVKAIAMRPRDHFDAHIVAGSLEQTAGATIGVNDEEIIILGAMFGHGFADPFGNFLGAKMQDCRQADQIHMGPAVCLFDVQNLARQCTTGDQQNAPFCCLKIKPLMGELFVGRFLHFCLLKSKRPASDATGCSKF